MTQQEAKNELRPIKNIEHDIRVLELEIERVMTVATKMTPSYGIKTPSNNENKLEDAIAQADEYKSKLLNLLRESVRQKNYCLSKIELMETQSLKTILMYYYFMDHTLEQTAEHIGRSYQWTYTMFSAALDEYCKISEKIAIT